MKFLLDDRQRQHDPQHFLVRGTIQASPEQPARIDALLAGALSAGCTRSTVKDHGLAPLCRIHSAEYLDFLQHIHSRWRELPDAADEVIPNVHPDRRGSSYPQSAIGQAGYHQADIACPIGAATWESAYWSAQTAISAAELLIQGEHSAYALCRPPGHHAFADLAGGFCFLNNSAIAAQHLLQHGLRPAILDVDVHHGNGTQGIFYHRADVLTVSVHTDPASFYPFFWGHAHERGEGAGLGCNLNLPLAQGSGDDAFVQALSTAGSRLRSFGANVLVVALGLDAHENDPLRGMSVSTAGFGNIGATIARFSLPTLFVQEGGYLCQQLGENLASVLHGFDSALE